MGILKAGIGSAAGVLADSWREYFYCPSMAGNVLAVKGEHREQKRSSNKHGDDNVISNGSIIAVNEGQCMIIVNQGQIVEVSAEPGEFVYDSSTEPSLFYGDLGENIAATFEQFKKRVGFGGDTAVDQRVYFINTKELLGNKYGTANPVPFRVVDRNANIDIDVSIRCHGEFSYRIVDPILFYTSIAGNFDGVFTRDKIDSQLKSDLLTALQPAFAKISEMGIRYSSLPGHTYEIANAINDQLKSKWEKQYGIIISSVGVNSVTASEEDEKMLKELQKTAVFQSGSMANATMVNATANAMQDAAKNTATGPMMAFAGMNMAQQTGLNNMQAMYQTNAQQAQMQQAPQQQAPQMQAQSAASWTCQCGTVNTGNFCSNCGSPKPQPATWTCQCGTVNTGNYCSNCGTKRA